MTQEEVAQKMQVSRPTVTRMLARAHRTVAEALVQGKAICIEGGDYRLGQQCGSCGQWAETKDGELRPECCCQQAAAERIRLKLRQPTIAVFIDTGNLATDYYLRQSFEGGNKGDGRYQHL